MWVFFFFKQKTAYVMRISDWSSDVCSSDLLLDQRVIELAWRLPVEMLRRDGAGKWPLRQLFDRYLPSELRDRPKQGFAIPVAEWLRGPLRDWAEHLLDLARMEADEIGRAWCMERVCQ